MAASPIPFYQEDKWMHVKKRFRRGDRVAAPRRETSNSKSPIESWLSLFEQFGAVFKWLSASLTPPPGLASAG
jgi:hypothetical protein